MKQARVTMRDIADKIGVSVSAVSRALGGSSEIGPKTRAAIHDAAEELGYEPNSAARQLKMQRTDTVGLILPPVADLRFSDPFFSEFLTGLVAQLEKFGVELLVSADGDTNPAAPYLKRIRSSRVDGFIIVRTQLDDPRIATLMGHKIPFVAFGRTRNADDFSYVDEDGEKSMIMVVDHLVELGHTRLVCLAEPVEYTKSHNRVLGFLRGLESHGLPVSEDSVVVGGYRQESGRETAEHILDRADPPTAIVGCNDLLALGAMSAASDRGLVVGSDVSITGFDDIALAVYAHPPLTTVRNSAHDSGRLTADILGRQIRGEHVADHQVLLDLELVVRGSTGPPQAAPQDEDKEKEEQSN